MLFRLRSTRTGSRLVYERDLIDCRRVPGPKSSVGLSEDWQLEVHCEQSTGNPKRRFLE